MAQPGIAKFVEFNPASDAWGEGKGVGRVGGARVRVAAVRPTARPPFLQVRATDVALPPGASFVIANSLAVSKKARMGHGGGL